MKFPTTEWFQALADTSAQKPDVFRRLGFCDAAVGIKVLADDGLAEDRGFVLTFDGYKCKSVKDTAAPAEASDFVLEGKFGAWKEMVENVRANHGPDLKHTLNYLTLPGVPMKVVAGDQLKQDLFFRYNGTLQEFFNGAESVETEFF
jgi:hypothetical protein